MAAKGLAAGAAVDLVAVEALAAVIGRCFRQFAVTAAVNVKFLLDQLVKNRFFAMIVSEKTAATPDRVVVADLTGRTERRKDQGPITRPNLTL